MYTRSQPLNIMIADNAWFLRVTSAAGPEFFFFFFYCFFFFFFLAEDGIRDRDVTGVQTCALPISVSHSCPGTVLASFIIRVTSSVSLSIILLLLFHSQLSYRLYTTSDRKSVV